MSRRVLFITGCQGWCGGVERACAEVTSQLARASEDEITILSAVNGRSSFFEVDDRVALEEIYAQPRSLQLHAIDFIRRLRAFIKQHRPDVIVIVETFLAAFVVPAAARLPVTLVNWEHFGVHASLGVPLRRIARRMAARFCHHVVVLTDVDLSLWLERYRIDERRISVISNINPMHRYADMAAEARLPKGGQADSTRRTVLAVGRLEQVKGFDLLIDAWRNIDPAAREGWCLRIVGDGSMRERLEALVRQWNLGEQVELPGRTENIAEEYRAADIFALSSHHEGFVLVVMEAMSFELPVVSFDCPTGPRTIIQHGSNGVLVEHLNVTALASELQALMRNAERRQALGRQGRVTVQNYSPPSIMGKWSRLLDALCRPLGQR